MDMIHMTCVLRESNNSQFDVYIYSDYSASYIIYYYYYY